MHSVKRYRGCGIDNVQMHIHMIPMSELSYDDCHCLALRRSARHVTRFYDRFLQPSGLSAAQFSLLSVIGLRPSIRAAALGEIMAMERTTLLRNLKPLQTAGWIGAKRAAGERAYLYELTDAGKALMRTAVPLWSAAQQAFEDRFGAQRASALRQANLALIASAAAENASESAEPQA